MLHVGEKVKFVLVFEFFCPAKWKYIFFGLLQKQIKMGKFSLLFSLVSKMATVAKIST